MKGISIFLTVMFFGFASLTSAQTTSFTASADVAQEVPAPTINPAIAAPSGTFAATYDAGTGMITVSGNFTLQSPFNGAPGAHLHLGAPGVTGGVIVNLTPGVTTSGTSGTFSGTYPVASNVADLLAGNFYLNIHSTGNPSGEIRGQLLVVPEPIPTMGEWGLMVLGLMIIIFGTVAIKARSFTPAVS